MYCYYCHTNTHLVAFFLSLGDVGTYAGISNMLLALYVVVEALRRVVDEQHCTTDLAHFHRTSFVHLLVRTQHFVTHLHKQVRSATQKL